MVIDINDWATYRHEVTGLVGVYPVRLGEADPHLTRVPDDAKPLAYTPIPHEAVEAHRAARESDEGELLDDEEEE